MSTDTTVNWLLETVRSIVALGSPIIAILFAKSIFKKESHRWEKQKMREGGYELRNYILKKELGSWEAMYRLTSYFAPNTSAKTIISGKKGAYIFRKQQGEDFVKAVYQYMNEDIYGMYIESKFTKDLTHARVFTETCIDWCQGQGTISLKDEHAKQFFTLNCKLRKHIKEQKNMLKENRAR